MTIDEIRARWAGIGPWNDADHPVDEIYAAHFPRETAAVIAAPTDIDYLLTENARLRTALRNLCDEFCVMEASDGGLAAYVEAEKILALATRQRNPDAIKPRLRRNRG